MSDEFRDSRRGFLRKGALALACLPAAGAMMDSLGPSGLAFAADKPVAKGPPLPAGQKAVKETDPVAASFGYRQDASKVDAAKYPMYQAGSLCSNCRFYISLNEGWGTCQMIQPGVVFVKGWCSVYNKKT